MVHRGHYNIYGVILHTIMFEVTIWFLTEQEQAIFVYTIAAWTGRAGSTNWHGQEREPQTRERTCQSTQDRNYQPHDTDEYADGGGGGGRYEYLRTRPEYTDVDQDHKP